MHVPQTEVILRHGDAELARVTLPPGEYVIGRSAEVEIFADTPLISRRHAQLTINYDHVLLEDLGSSNGTFVADQAITEATRLFPNQDVRLGDVVLEVHRARATVEMGMSLAPAQAAIRRILPDELLGEKRYTIGNQVARGGMGAIMLAKQQTTQRNVAMKVMLETRDEGDVLRFVEEAQITSQLEHPNIVPIYELGVDEQDQLFYTMKFVRGITLKKVLELIEQGVPETVKKYPLSTLLTIFQKTCDALAFAHSKGVIHRDLKPENLMLGDFGEVLVMDWGLAKLIGRGDRPAGDRVHSSIASARTAHGDSSRTLMGAVMGTPQYMSPEQARGEIESLDQRSDVYALGTILFEIIYLHAPVSGMTAMEVVEKVTRGVVEWDASTRTSKKALQGGAGLPHLPGGRPPDSLIAVCRKALALLPEQRYATVSDLQRDLTSFQTGFATTAENAGAWKQFRLLVGRNRGVTTAIAAAIAIIAVVTGVFTANVIRERNRAETSLHELRGTAPTFAAQARSLVEEGKVDEAIAKIAYATQLDPTNPDYLLQRGNYLQVALHLHDAIALYRQVLAARPGDPAAQQNLEISERLLAENGGKDELSQALVIKLVDSLLAQGRQIEANPLAQRVGKGGSTTEAAIRARLKDITAQPNWNSSRLHVQQNGTFYLGLNGLKVSNLNAVRGFPISYIDVDDPNFTDLTPLTGLPLTHLGLGNTGVSDLSPLAGMPIESLNLSRTKVTDLSSLRGMKLKELYLYSLNLTDLKPLEGLRLERLDAGTNKFTDIEPLRGMPIRELNLSGNHVPDLSPLTGMPLESLTIPGLDLQTLPPLQGLPLRSLNLSGNRISDLRPIAGLKQLTSLILNGNPVGDLTPLAGMPLKSLDLGTDARAIDLTPLASLKDLEDITLPRGFIHEEVLKKMPKLRRARIGAYQPYLLPIKQFWAELKPEWMAQAHIRGLIQFSGFKHQAQSPIIQDPDGSLAIDLARADGDTIPSFSGPIIRFSCDWSAFTDLAPLRGLRLQRLSFSGTKISDLTPVKGMPLQLINFSGAPVTDLSPLQGMPIESINFGASKVREFSALQGLPLKEVYAYSLGLSNFSFLRGLHLRRLDLNNNPVKDISIIADMPLENLNVSSTPITDLSPLRGKPLQVLNIARTQVRDLEPLRGLPLTDLTVDSIPAQDFSPLLDLLKLERLRVGGTPQQIAILRKHPTLKYLVQGPNGPYLGVEEFWAYYDAHQAQQK